MKRQDILEIIVSNPQAIFVNANYMAGKYSEYPSVFQVVGMAYDKSYVRVKRVSVNTTEWVLDGETGLDIAKDEHGNWIKDTRPVAERTYMTYGEVKSMPTRLVLKSDKTEQGMIAEAVAKQEQRAIETAKRIAEQEITEQKLAELKTVLVSVGLLDDDEAEQATRWGRLSLEIRDEKVVLLTSLLKSALVEVGV
jgi:hypothetical protein